MQIVNQSLARADVFEVIDRLDAALGVVRRQGGPKTTLDVYIVSVFSTLRRSLLQQALNAVEMPSVAGLED